MSNYKTLAILRLLKSTIEIFINIFFVMYFLELSNNNIFKLGIYYIVVNSTIFFTIYFVKNFCKTNKRINILRLGILFNFIYFLMLVLLKEKMVDYMLFIGIIYGLEEGLYYSVYNFFESNGIPNNKRAMFTGIFTSLKSLIVIIIPLVFGTVINENGFIKCIIMVLVLVIFQLIFSFLFKDVKLENKSKTDIKKYKEVTKDNIAVKDINKVMFLYGIIYTGSFRDIITVYTISMLGSSLSLGIYNSIFAIFACLLGILFAKVIPKGMYKQVMRISSVGIFLGIVMLVVNVNFFTIVVFNLINTFSSTLCGLIVGNSEINIANHKQIKKDFKIEYFVEMEKNIYFGRMIGYILFIILGFSASLILKNTILIFFGIIVVALNSYTIKMSNNLLLNKDIE